MAKGTKSNLHFIDYDQTTYSPDQLKTDEYHYCIINIAITVVITLF